MPYPSNSRRDEIRRAVAARERAEARIGSITTTVAVASVVTAGPAVTMPGPARTTGSAPCAARPRTVRSPFLRLGTGSSGSSRPAQARACVSAPGSSGSGFSLSPRSAPGPVLVRTDARLRLRGQKISAASSAASALIPDIEASGLTGRGGAAFPVHRKLAAVAAARGRKVVIANGAESEPASRKDEILLRAAPHLVLDGLQLAAEVTGASDAYLCLHRGAGSRIGRALAERAADARTGSRSRSPRRRRGSWPARNRRW